MGRSGASPCSNNLYATNWDLILYFLRIFKGVFIAPTNAYYENNKMKYKANNKNEPEKFIPERSLYSGANWFDLDKKLLYILIKGSEPIDVRMVPVVQVSHIYFRSTVNISSFLILSDFTILFL